MHIGEVSPKETVQQIVSAHAEMLSNIVQNSRKQAYLERVVCRNGHVVLAVLLRSKAHVTAPLTRNRVTQRPEGLSQF